MTPDMADRMTTWVMLYSRGFIVNPYNLKGVSSSWRDEHEQDAPIIHRSSEGVWTSPAVSLYLEEFSGQF